MSKMFHLATEERHFFIREEVIKSFFASTEGIKT